MIVEVDGKMIDVDKLEFEVGKSDGKWCLRFESREEMVLAISLMSANAEYLRCGDTDIPLDVTPLHHPNIS